MAILTSAQLLAQARASIRQVDTAEALGWIKNDRYVFVDVREADELQAGKIPGAVHIPRGTLEFCLDSAIESHVAALSGEKRLVFVCGSGGRAALATKLACDFGYDALCLDGGFKAWKAAGGPIE